MISDDASGRSSRLTYAASMQSGPAQWPLDAYRGADGGDADKWRAHTLAILELLELLERRSRHLPERFAGDLPLVAAMWRQGPADAAILEDLRVACWRFLKGKHGTGTKVADDEDRAVRLLICVCFAEGTLDDALETDWSLPHYCPTDAPPDGTLYGHNWAANDLERPPPDGQP